MKTELDQFDDVKLDAVLDALSKAKTEPLPERVAESIRSRQQYLESLRQCHATQTQSEEPSQPVGFLERLEAYQESRRRGEEPTPPPVLWEDDPDGPWVTRPDAARKAESAT